MRIPIFARRRLVAFAERTMRRSPDFVVGGSDPYLKRWWVIPRNKWFNVYVHRFLRSDDDRALHDHMYVNASLVLDGGVGYDEHFLDGSISFRPLGTVVFRRPTTAHRIALIDEEPVTTLFVTGPRVREWGFHCPQGWRYWTEFVGKSPGGNVVGRGCD